MNWIVETTDTFGGEANYSWCNRHEITTPENASDLSLVRLFKSAVGWSGVRGRSAWNGDLYEFRPYGLCQVLFAIPQY